MLSCYPPSFKAFSDSSDYFSVMKRSLCFLHILAHAYLRKRTFHFAVKYELTYILSHLELTQLFLFPNKVRTLPKERTRHSAVRKSQARFWFELDWNKFRATAETVHRTLIYSHFRIITKACTEKSPKSKDEAAELASWLWQAVTTGCRQKKKKM